MRHLILAPLLLLAVPALAQDTPAVDLVAIITGGMSHGASVNLGPVADGGVTRTAPGVFVVSAEGGSVIHIEITEGKPCVFDVKFAIGDDPSPGGLRFDFNRMKAITFENRGAEGSLNGIFVTLDGPFDATQNVYPDGHTENTANTQLLATTMSFDEVKAAGDALRAACPGVAG